MIKREKADFSEMLAGYLSARLAVSHHRNPYLWTSYNFFQWNIKKACPLLFTDECTPFHKTAKQLTIILYLRSFKWSQLGAHYFLVYLFQHLYMFRATMCPSSGELTVSMQHWYFSFCVGGCLVCRPDNHPHRVKKYQCPIDTVSSPDDGHIDARNMKRNWNECTKN